MTSLKQIGRWLEKHGIAFYEIVDDTVIFMVSSSTDGYQHLVKMDFRQKCFIARLYIVDDEKELFKITKHRKKAMRFMLSANDMYLLGRWCYDRDKKIATYDIVIPAHDTHLEETVFDHIVSVMLGDGRKSADKLIGIVKEGAEPDVTMEEELEALLEEFFKEIASKQKEKEEAS